MQNYLCDLEPGERCAVLGIVSEGSMRRRLRDIGIIDGTWLECLQKSPLGDPVAYNVRGAVIALRREDSAKIAVEMEG